MDDEKASLNYDCNYNLFLAKHLIGDMENPRDRQNAVKWICFLMKSDRSIAEMQLRNDFMYFLVLNLQEGHLKSPFKNSPPVSGTLMDIAGLIPGKTDKTEDPEDILIDLDETGREKAMIMSKSPDGGAFLSLQPVPHEGSFCYLTISTKKRDD